MWGGGLGDYLKHEHLFICQLVILYYTLIQIADSFVSEMDCEFIKLLLVLLIERGLSFALSLPPSSLYRIVYICMYQCWLLTIAWISPYIFLGSIFWKWLDSLPKREQLAQSCSAGSSIFYPSIFITSPNWLLNKIYLAPNLCKNPIILLTVIPFLMKICLVKTNILSEIPFII